MSRERVKGHGSLGPLNMNGKSIRRASSLEGKNAHLLYVVCHHACFVLKQLAVYDKSNEITVVPALVE